VALPGVRVGPLDPESTAQFGQIGAGQTARQALRMHSQMYPPELKRQLARPRDDQRTRGLDMDEVRGYLSGQDLPNGDPMVPEGGRVVSAQVRGDRDSGFVLTFQYSTEKGRIVKWFAPYNADVLPSSFDDGVELTRLHEMKERGVVAHDSEGTHTQILERELAASRAEVRRLREYAESGDAGDPPQDTGENVKLEGDTRSTENLVAELERLRAENAELRQGQAQADLVVAQSGGGQSPASAASADEPFDGYDKLKADQVADYLRDEERSDEESLDHG
jgi:hypothetical protein